MFVCKNKLVKMNYFLSLLFSCLFVAVLSFPPSELELSPTYKDYVYNGNTDAFYKLHSKPLHRNRAEAACKAEGAELMIPSSEEDKYQAAELMMREDKIGDSIWIGQNGEKKIIKDEPVDSNNCYNAMYRNQTISAIKCTGYLPFICKAKVTAAEARSAELCPAPGYRYYPETGSCYYVPPYKTTWEDAFHYCRDEGAHLLVLNSEQESKLMKSFIKTLSPVSKDLYYLAGLKADKPSRSFRTIFGETPEEVGYTGWSLNEPNNWGGDEYCSSIKRDGLYNDSPCDSLKAAFICEIEVSSERN